MLELARTVPDVTRFINFWPADAAAYFQKLAPDFNLIPQRGGDLGARLDNVLTDCLSNGFDRGVITNSDSPTLPADYLGNAFEALDGADVVLGPCDDGGYYLIGLTGHQPRLLREVGMSTPTVLRGTLGLAKAEGLRVSLLPAWYDVDTVHELNRLEQNWSKQHRRQHPYTRRCLGQLSRR